MKNEKFPEEMRISQKMRITSTQYVHSHYGFVSDMFPFPPVLRRTLSGGSAISDSSLLKSMGPHNTLSIKDEMETA